MARSPSVSSPAESTAGSASTTRRRTRLLEDEDQAGASTPSPQLQRKFTTSSVAAALKNNNNSAESHSRALQRKYSRRTTVEHQKSGAGGEGSPLNSEPPATYANLSLADELPPIPRPPRAKPVAREYDAHVKLLLLGDSAVGKSSILMRFCGGTFDKEHVLTIGVDFKSRVVECKGERLKLQVWDTAGQERFRNLTPVYFRTAAGVLLVFDVTCRKSFENVSTWMRDLDETAREEAFRVLVGNKCDLDAEREVSWAEATALARSFGVKYYETSAKTNVNIEAPFREIAKDIRAFQLDPSKQPPARVAGIALQSDRTPKASGRRWTCCAEM